MQQAIEFKRDLISHFESFTPPIEAEIVNFDWWVIFRRSVLGAIVQVQIDLTRNIVLRFVIFPGLTVQCEELILNKVASKDADNVRSFLNSLNHSLELIGIYTNDLWEYKGSNIYELKDGEDVWNITVDNECSVRVCKANDPGVVSFCGPVFVGNMVRASKHMFKVALDNQKS